MKALVHRTLLLRDSKPPFIAVRLVEETHVEILRVRATASSLPVLKRALVKVRIDGGRPLIEAGGFHFGAASTPSVPIIATHGQTILATVELLPYVRWRDRLLWAVRDFFSPPRVTVEIDGLAPENDA